MEFSVISLLAVLSIGIHCQSLDDIDTSYDPDTFYGLLYWKNQEQSNSAYSAARATAIAIAEDNGALADSNLASLMPSSLWDTFTSVRAEIDAIDASAATCDFGDTACTPGGPTSAGATVVTTTAGNATGSTQILTATPTGNSTSTGTTAAGSTHTGSSNVTKTGTVGTLGTASSALQSAKAPKATEVAMSVVLGAVIGVAGLGLGL